MQYDETLSTFIEKNVKFEKVDHLKAKKETLFSDERKYDETFTGCMVEKQSILDYQKERLVVLQKELTNFKASNAQDELDAELNQPYK